MKFTQVYFIVYYFNYIGQKQKCFEKTKFYFAFYLKSEQFQPRKMVKTNLCEALVFLKALFSGLSFFVVMYHIASKSVIHAGCQRCLDSDFIKDPWHSDRTHRDIHMGNCII